MSTVIIDYGMGNLGSVANAFRMVGASVTVSPSPADLREADRIVLPGVGAFGEGMRNLRSGGWVDALEEEVRKKLKPFLGICLGMHVLASVGTEGGTCEGLGWIDGTVELIDTGDPMLRVPHIGWNDVEVLSGSSLYEDVKNNEDFYFAHSYVLRPSDNDIVSGVCEYGVEMVASIEMGNIVATQYHPEKSQRAGLAVIRNFLAEGEQEC